MQGFADPNQCSSCAQDNILNKAAHFFRTVLGQLLPRVEPAYYDDKIAPAFPQPHKIRDGIPFTGLIPAIRIDAPSNPDLILNPVTATTWYLRAVGREISAPRRRTMTPYSKKGAQSGWWGRSG